MLKVENLRTFNWEGALRSLRNPMNGDKFMMYHFLDKQYWII